MISFPSLGIRFLYRKGKHLLPWTAAPQILFATLRQELKRIWPILLRTIALQQFPARIPERVELYSGSRRSSNTTCPHGWSRHFMPARNHLDLRLKPQR